VDARLREGIRLFNAGHYFEAHEALEEFYQRAEETRKPFVEALIQLAAAVRLARDFDEAKGSTRMVRQALIRLENYRPVYLGVKVAGLMQAMEAWANETEKSHKAAAHVPKISTQFFGLF
jgi:predicted metal-dependent hydrolase